MVIVEREGKYFLQISNGELELSEKQAKARLEKGTAVLKDGAHSPSEQPGEVAVAEASEAATVAPGAESSGDTIATDPGEESGKSAAVPLNKIPAEAKAFILSDEYYDNIIFEFEKVYVSGGRKEETAIELLDYCQKSIDHLKVERSQPNADLALLDYQRICWLRIIVFLQALTGVPAPRHADTIAQEKEKLESERALVRQLLVIQLLQETGAFPYADALKSITHDNIIGLVSRMLNKDKTVIKNAMQRSGDILLRRNVTEANATRRLNLLTDVESYFAELPYNHVIIRLRSLKEFYKNYEAK
ncbi:MAG: hypothetical protein JNL72_05040 [Flavipsychrobacter sp.]|nr:hypothetical protein [Flavipsychrobacter sp.]